MSVSDDVAEMLSVRSTSIVVLNRQLIKGAESKVEFGHEAVIFGR